LSFQSISCPVLIGRTAILEALDQLIKQVGESNISSPVVLISGDAGVGKTRMVVEMRTRVAQLDWEIFQGNCFETDRTLQYAPLLDMLRAFCATSTGDEIRAAFDLVAPDLINFLPELRSFFPDLEPDPLLSPDPEKRRIFSALAQYFINYVKNQKRLIVIEDLHWIDDTSLEFVLYLARQLAIQPAPGMLLFTYRNDQSHRSLMHFLAELDRSHLATEFQLPYLTQAEVDVMLRTIFDQPRPVRIEFLNAIYNLTEGNPFFIEEVLKSLLVAGEIYYSEKEKIWDRKPMSELHIPRSVQDAVYRQTEKLSEAARQILTLASVVGRRFDFSTLEQLVTVLGPKLSVSSEVDLVNLLKDLIAAQLLVEESGDRFAFRHELTRQAIYTQLLARERKLIHQRVAQRIESIYENTSQIETRLNVIAHHYYEAEDWEKALAYSRLAGEKAQKLYAPRQAIKQFTRALHAASQASITPSINLYLMRGKAYRDLDEFEQAQSDFLTALELGQASGDRHIEWQALLDLGLLWSGHNYLRGGDYFQRSLEIARSLGDPAKLAHTLNRIGNWNLNRGYPSEALRYHDEALKIFETLQDKNSIAQTLDLLGITHYVGGDLVNGTACYDQSLSLFRELNDRQGMINSMTYLALRSCFTTEVLDVDSLSQLIPAGESGLQMARDIGWRSAESAILSCLAQCLCAMGEYGRALSYGQSALLIAEDIQHSEWICSAYWALGTIQHQLFNLSEAQKQLEHGLGMAREIRSTLYIQDVSSTLALNLIAQGDLEQAERILDTVLAPEYSGETWGQRLCWCTRAELALARGNPDHALRILDQLIMSAKNIETHGPRSISRLTFLRGKALANLDRLPDAEIELRAAQSVARTQGRKHLLWRSDIELGNVLLALKQDELAEMEFSSARAMVGGMAVTIHDDAHRNNFLLHAFLTFPESPILSPRKAAKKKYDGLTEREREIAALIALGKSNRQIAQDLYVSERTAATHVSNILNKLDFSSRVQIAAWAIENGLASSE
jgi:predicted ATPase/DNA-binding CsgD family transcriptional regulator